MTFKQIDPQEATKPIEAERLGHCVSQQLRVLDMSHVHCTVSITIRGTLLTRLALQMHSANSQRPNMAEFPMP